MHVFTYGTLMFPEVWQAIVGRPFDSVPATAAGFTIYRVRDAVFPGIIAATVDQSVLGVAYLDVDAASIQRLDLFENDFYRRMTITVTCDDGRQLQADAYVVPAERQSVLSNETWDAGEFVAKGGLAEFISRFQRFARLTGDK